MKNKFKKFASISIFALISLLVVSCDNDDLVPEFTLQSASEDVTFEFTPADEYLISTGTMGNIAERFVWNEVDFGVQTEIGFQLQGSIDETFEDYDSTNEIDSGILTVTNAEITVSDLNKLALLLGIEAGESGQVFFRVRAFTGSGLGVDIIESYSDVVTLKITILEETSSGGIEISPWSVVGSAITGNDDGWNLDLPLYTTDNSNVFVAYVTLSDGEFKIRKDKDWAESYGNGGSNIVISAGNYKITFDFSTTTVSYEEFSWGIVGSATPIGWPANPQTIDDEQLRYDSYSNSWKVVIYLTAGSEDAIKFRMNNDWGTNYGYNGTEGTLGGDNIPITVEGYYIVTVDFNNLTYSLELIDNVWGIVGDATPIGWPATPLIILDQKLTPDYGSTSNIWIINNFPLTSGGAIKFRANDDWGTNYGYNGTEGTLGGDNIPISESGYYNATLNLDDLTYELIKVADL